MEKIISKMRMKRVIEILCIIAASFTLITGIVGTYIGKAMAEDTMYIYSYKGYSDLIHEINSSFLEMKVINLEVKDGYKEEYTDRIEELNKKVTQNIDKYNETDYEEEENYVKNIESSYKKYYDLTLMNVNQYKNGEGIVDNIIDEMDENETILSNNINAILDYLDYWAKHDYDASTDKAKVATIVYVVIIASSLAIFISLAIIVIKIFDRQVRYINKTLKRVSEGELNIELECKYNNEFDDMKASLNKTLHNFNNIINGLKSNSKDIDGKVENLNYISSELSAAVDNVHLAVENITNGVEEQADDLRDINTILNEFSTKISEFINNVSFLDNSAGIIIEKTNDGTVKMDELSEAFTHVNTLIKSFTNKVFVLSNTVREISSITNFINDIAEQTNLLALNAAIESARVGDAGKGFAVVAEQIRTLAEQSKESVNVISKLIDDVSRETNEISKDSNIVDGKVSESMVIIDDALKSFGGIITEINDIASKIGILNSTAEEIDRDKEVIGKKVDKSYNIAEQIVASTEEVLSSLTEINGSSKSVEKTSIDLNEVTNILEKEIHIFKTK